MRILFVVYSMSGGAGKQLSLTANALSGYGHEVTVYAYHWDKEPVVPLYDNVKFIPEHNIVSNPLKEYLSVPFRIRKLVKSAHVDVVIGWRTNAGGLVPIACAGMHIKTVFAERSDPYMEHNAKLAIAKFFCNFCDYGVFQTEMARDYYKRIAPKSVVIPNPFSLSGEIEEPLPYTTREKEIIFAGRFNIKQKRQDIALRAFQLVHERYPDYKLVFCGEGGDMDMVKSLTHELSLSDAVIFEGQVIDMKSRVRNSKMFILTSDYEGIPNVILEAFAWGLPVISTDCSPGGARVLIDDGVNGFIVQREDHRSLAKKMISLADDTQLATSIIENGIKKLQDFQPDIIYSKWNAFITHI